MEQYLKIFNTLQLPIDEIKKNVRTAYTEYRKLKKEAQNHRISFMEKKQKTFQQRKESIQKMCTNN